MPQGFFANLWARLTGAKAAPLPAVPTPAPPAVSRDDAVIDIAETTITEPSEGDYLKPYQDPGGIWTVGMGATYDVKGNPVTALTLPITALQSQWLLHRDMRAALIAVESDTTVQLTKDEEAALTDFAFNDGAGAYAKSCVLRDLNAGNYQQAANDLLLFNHAGGVVLAGLTKRCALRRALFLKPDDKLSVA